MSADNIRYIKQRDKSSCGPIALINILKWLGYHITYDFLDIARWACDWQDGRCIDAGTLDRDMNKALKYFKIKNKKILNPKIKDINKHLKAGGIVLIGYCLPRESTNHFSLCIGTYERYYIMVNDDLNETIIARTKKEIKKYIRKKLSEPCYVWLISENKRKSAFE